MIRLPCVTHWWHDVDDVEAARIVAALTAALADERCEPAGESLDYSDEMECPREVLGWAGDVEMYAEYTKAALFNAGILRENADGEHEVIPWAEREESQDGARP